MQALVQVEWVVLSMQDGPLFGPQTERPSTGPSVCRTFARGGIALVMPLESSRKTNSPHSNIWAQAFTFGRPFLAVARSSLWLQLAGALPDANAQSRCHHCKAMESLQCFVVFYCRSTEIA